MPSRLTRLIAYWRRKRAASRTGRKPAAEAAPPPQGTPENSNEHLPPEAAPEAATFQGTPENLGEEPLTEAVPDATAQSSELEEVSRTSLMGLPPELRNLIWRFALLSDDPIELAPGHARQPALLHVSVQVTRESMPIFLLENKFITAIADLKMRVPREHWLNTRVPTHQRTYRLWGYPSWKDLKLWLKRVHSGEYGAFVVLTDGEPCWQAVRHAFEIVFRLAEVEWAVVDKVLEDYKLGSESGGGGWHWIWA